MTRAWLLGAAVLLLGGCAVSGAPAPLHPRERALYWELQPGDAAAPSEARSLMRQRVSQTWEWPTQNGGSPIRIRAELRGERQGETLYEGSLRLRALDGAWEWSQRLPLRSSGRWEFALDPDANPGAWPSLQVQLSSDPLWELSRQHPQSR